MPKKKRSRPEGPRRRRKRAPKKNRLPRWGWLHESFGVPLLVGFGVVVFAICGGLAVYLFSQAREFSRAGAASETWPAAPGTVIRSGYSTRFNKRGPLATIELQYGFEVDGRQYTGSTLSFEKLDSLSEDDAQQRLQPYPPGAECQVFYDPDSPADNVLEKGMKSGNTGQMLAALAFFLGGLFGLYDGVAGAINAHRFPTKSMR